MPGDRLLTEWRTISISRPGGETLVDTHCNLQASRALTLTGDLQHAGFHFRAHDEVSSRTSETSFIESPAGFVAGNDLEWCQMTFGRGARRYAVALYNAPDNPVEELSQRAYGRFGYFFIQSIADGANLALNYRIRLAEADLPDGSSFEIYEAEDATLGGWATIASNSGGYTGSGYIDYQTPSGEFIEWTVPVESAGDYSASIRYALLSGDRPLELTVNGVVVDATFSFPATGGWTSWGTVPLTLSLNAGSNTVRVTAIGSSGANVDHLLIELLGNADPDGGAQASRATNDQAYLNYQQWLQMDLDSDLDGLPETWEARFFGDLSRDGTDDEDGDGTSNLTDQVAATDPTNPQSSFRIKTLEADVEGGFVLRWDSVTGRSYEVLKSTSLAGGWSPVSGRYAGTGGELSFSDGFITLPRAFFQISVTRDWHVSVSWFQSPLPNRKGVSEHDKIFLIPANHPMNLRSKLFGIGMMLCYAHSMSAAPSAESLNKGVYVEHDGMVVMEAERTNSALDLWTKKTEIEGYTGDAYLDFSGNTPESGPAISPLEFNFRIERAGLYYLHLFCARETVTIKDEERDDVANDCYVRVEGDYGSGPAPGNRHGKDAPLALLKSDVKFFGGNDHEFVWASGNRIDPGGKTNKRVAVYNFKAGNEYKLTVSGRSKSFKLDRIVFRHGDVAAETAENIELAESSRLPLDASALVVIPKRGEVPAGRLAIVTDGNAVDPDDVCATPISLAMIRAMGLEERLVHFNHSCELVNKPQFKAAGQAGLDEEIARRQMNQESCDETAKLWGGFDHLTFWNCRTQRDQAVADLRAALNASTAADPLWIVEAGEPDVIYEAAVGAKPNVMQYVRIITHHPNNDQGSFHNLDDVLTLQPPGAKVLRISDQNRKLKTPLASWYWARDHADPRIQWIWERGEFAANRAFVDPQFKYRPIAQKFDCSDAGMTLYWLSGADNGGLTSGGPEDIRKILVSFADE